MTAARKGASGQAQQILSHMVSSGLDLTPRAYHGLIFSYMKAGDDSGALNALHAALDTSGDSHNLSGNCPCHLTRLY